MLFFVVLLISTGQEWLKVGSAPGDGVIPVSIPFIPTLLLDQKSSI